MFHLPSGFQCFIECIATLQNQPENHSFWKTLKYLELYIWVWLGLGFFGEWFLWCLIGFFFFLIWAAELIITIYFLKYYFKGPSNTNPNTAQQVHAVHNDLTNCTKFTWGQATGQDLFSIAILCSQGFPKKPRTEGTHWENPVIGTSRADCNLSVTKQQLQAFTLMRAHLSLVVAGFKGQILCVQN